MKLFSTPSLKTLQLPPGIICRPLEYEDYHRGFMKALSQLTDPGAPTSEDWDRRFKEMVAIGDYYIIVLEDLSLPKTSSIIGAGTILLERKFLRGCASTGHIEDIVVDSRYRGKKLGIAIIEQLKHIGVMLGCYKILLDCSDKNVKFYEACGFTKKEVQMVVYTKDIAPKL
mmetsp:Transcript_13012/g.33200  ORF Transcript_13012/g.33200 Transcript_13012/m.33200 type:complete len:171 (-) Transcript_13012:68-580(-)|eukprot:CAMPEP_0177640002 /NCGR_PEP_ID=MMETSP0447-20121125/6316_1 /TAXON_ID=0 /ORGANISM="Stygamoeba regulata, Strain BSH-02190019" /LENGTH=170 /DNA_ID=CAMNT_0019142055 /DNA_START=62 /DNA_END=574 /DNA_ORIENTATION=+